MLFFIKIFMALFFTLRVQLCSSTRMTRGFNSFGRKFSFCGVSKSCKPTTSPRRFLSALFSTEEDIVASDSKSGLLRNFITNIIESDIAAGKNGGRVVTRFPPEPNGYLHLGHAKSINFNFGVAKAYKGVTHMRFDDTNPAKEDIEYVRSILEDVRWLTTGSTKPLEDQHPPWNGEIRHASDYFQIIYDSAEYLILNGLAYVDDLTPEEMKAYRGTLTEAGKDSPFRNRSVDENLRLFRAMKAGEFPDGQCVLRAKIDMSSGNINMRDPTLYRIKRASHPITGNQWCIYPMYDFAHAISDAVEEITHSLCTLEFKDHRPLYDWTIDNLIPSGLLPQSGLGWRPTQYEFSRLNLQFTVLSKRKLIQLVMERHVSGWDDPRMPTISGLRRRGYPSEAIRLFCDRVGISKAENNIDISVLEDCAREVLNVDAPRIFAVADPLKVTITNWPEGKVELFASEEQDSTASNEIPFTGNVYIQNEDFFDTGVDGSIPPPKGYKRLLPGGTVRLKYAYVIRCDEVVRDPDDPTKVLELKCSYDAATRSGVTPEGAKRVKGIVQWVSQEHGVKAELALYDRLFNNAYPGKDQPDGDFLKDLNPNSLKIVPAVVERRVLGAQLGARFQFERLGYFSLDIVNNREGYTDTDVLQFNRIVGLKDTWANSQSNSGSPVPAAGAKGAAPTVSAAEATANVNVKDPANQDAIEDIRRIEMRVGLVLSAEKHPDADSLYVEKVDCGDAAGPRTIISGLVKYMTSESLVGRKVVVLCNLKPSKMRGILSEGMLLAASTGAEGETEVVELLTPPDSANVGELITVQGFLPPKPDEQLKSKSAMEVWKRVATLLKTNEQMEATFSNPENRFITSAGVCTVQSLKNASIR